MKDNIYGYGVINCSYDVSAYLTSGKIESIQYWHEGLPAYVDLDPASPPSVSLGTQLVLAFLARNTGPSAFTGRVDLTLTKPDGSTLKPAAVSGQDLLVLPTQGWFVRYGEAVWDSARNMYVAANGLTLNQVGSWTGLAELKEVEVPVISCSIYRAGGRWGVAPYWYCIWRTARLGAWYDDGIGWRDAYQPCQVSGIYADEDVYLCGYDWGPGLDVFAYGPHGPFRLEDKAYYHYNLGKGTLEKGEA